jgi:hypothetical protein
MFALYEMYVMKYWVNEKLSGLPKIKGHVSGILARDNPSGRRFRRIQLYSTRDCAVNGAHELCSDEYVAATGVHVCTELSTVCGAQCRQR